MSKCLVVIYIMHQPGESKFLSTDYNTRVVVNPTIIRSRPLQPPIRLRYFGLVLWCLTSLSTLFQLLPWSSVYWWRKPEYPEKTIDLSQVTDNRLLWENVINYKIIYPSLYNQSYMYHVFYKFIQMSWIILTKRCLTCKG